MCAAFSTCETLTTQQSTRGGIGSRVHKGTALGEPVESLYRPSCMTVRVADVSNVGIEVREEIDRLTLDSLPRHTTEPLLLRRRRPLAETGVRS